MSNAQAVIAFVAKREARAAMAASRWAHVLSLELGWMGPGDAKRYVEACREAGLLRGEDDALEPAFDVKAVEIPRRLQPEGLPEGPPEAAAPASGFAFWLDAVASARGVEREAVLADVATLQDASGGLLHADVAILRLAARAGLDVKDAAVTLPGATQ